jgi:WbqC-like protein family
MHCAIMQPTYLPWVGYFNLISQVDFFVFLDDVQFERRSWQSRNRILLDGNEHWLTVPVHSERQTQRLDTIQIDFSQKWQRKHVLGLEQAYRKAPYFEEIAIVLECLQQADGMNLANLNIQIIQIIAQALNLKAKFITASVLNLPDSRSQHLLNICNALGCQEYLSPLGSQTYLIEEGIFQKSSVELSFQNYTPQPYPQLKSSIFKSHLSILDLIANIGIQQTIQHVTSSIS